MTGDLCATVMFLNNASGINDASGINLREKIWGYISPPPQGKKIEEKERRDKKREEKRSREENGKCLNVENLFWR